MKINKKILIALLMLVLVITSNLAYAALIPTDVILNKKIAITYNGETQQFKNANGEIVYPITFDGTTYLPIRSISCLFKAPIKWDGNTNSIYLGSGELDTIAAETISDFIPGEHKNISVYLNEDVKIYHSGDVQTFKDANGKVVYPLSYNGTTYLPVRAISGLYDANIQWDAETSTVAIAENSKKWNGKFVSNVDGYTEVVLTPTEEGINFVIKGSKFNSGFGGNSTAVINGNIAVYEKEDFETEQMVDILKFEFVNSKLVITALDEEFNKFTGEYILDDGSLTEVVLSNPDYIYGIYKNEDETKKLELVQLEEGLLDFTLTGAYAEEGFYITGGAANYANGVAIFEEELFDDVNKVEIQISGDTATVKATTTEKDGIYQHVSGTYIFKEKKVWNLEECKKQAQEIEISEDGFMY